MLTLTSNDCRDSIVGKVSCMRKQKVKSVARNASLCTNLLFYCDWVQEVIILLWLCTISSLSLLLCVYLASTTPCQFGYFTTKCVRSIITACSFYLHFKYNAYVCLYVFFCYDLFFNVFPISDGNLASLLTLYFTETKNQTLRVKI